LDERGELADAAALLAEDLLGVGGTDDDLRCAQSCTFLIRFVRETHLSASVGDADVTARVALLRELTGEELVELGVEDTVGHKLALLRDLGRHAGLLRE
jgi:hypothetical protein